jgi:hypothetical protein|tara:strand:- start:173 stop:418 length:246 start_codon:yes stop_codon:yes gene_type:complete
MNDHQDSENFSYERTWEEIYNLLHEAERKQNKHLLALQNTRLTKKQKFQHMRNYKGLQGVINALRWTLGDLHMPRKKVLGD